MLHKMLLSGVAVVGLTGLAGAADIGAADMPLWAPPPVYVPTWTGCYIGGHGGYGTTTSSSQFSPGFDVFQFGAIQLNESFDNRGVMGGGQAGCQLQTGTFVWGLEGDWSSFSNSSSRSAFSAATLFETDGTVDFISGTVIQQVSYDSLWSVRGRFGGIFSDVYHLYVTAGIGGARASYRSSELNSFNGVSPGSATNVTMNPTGIVFGAGAEWKIWPQFVIGAEYLHYALSSDTALPAASGTFDGPNGVEPISLITGPASSDHVHTNNVDVLRFRASYLFNWGR
jgi:outer membrane immunogenic protein